MFKLNMTLYLATIKHSAPFTLTTMSLCLFSPELIAHVYVHYMEEGGTLHNLSSREGLTMSRP